jgi:predicted MPP superfamily phosphohydrolase
MSTNDPNHSDESSLPTKTSRRKWLKRALGAAAVGAAGVLVDTFYVELHWLELVHHSLPIAGLPAAWSGRTLAQLSDLHIGPQVSDAYLIKSFDAITKLSPDVVVVTGDFMSLTNQGTATKEQLERVCSHLPRGRVATLGILGNHDYGYGWSDAELASHLTDILAAHGVRMLRNQVADLDGLQILGVDDLWSGHCEVAKALAASSPDAPRLALAHNPDIADLPAWQGYQGWLLSGHTHGGQCKPPFLPPPLLPVENRRYTSGEFDLFDGRRLYINRGVGHLLPVRFNCRPEITVHQLTQA